MITPDTTIAELRKLIPDELFSHLIYDPSGTGAGRFSDENRSLKEIQANDPTWNAEDMAFGLNALCRNLEKEEVLWDVYGAEEITACPEKTVVKLIRFPGQSDSLSIDTPRRTLILASGGAYGAVCHLPEAFPVAAEAAASGIDCFCLTYRVGVKAPLFPAPMEDLGAGIRFLFAHESELDISMEHYAVCGFSAGAHLTATWGLQEFGYQKYRLPAPDALILGYPMLNLWSALSKMPEPVRNFMLTGMLGPDYSEESCKSYNIDENAKEDYPPCFIVHAQDDTTTDPRASAAFAASLVDKKICCVTENPEHAGHGFGRGTESDAEEWVKTALGFWNDSAFSVKNI